MSGAERVSEAELLAVIAELGGAVRELGLRVELAAREAADYRKGGPASMQQVFGRNIKDATGRCMDRVSRLWGGFAMRWDVR